MKVYDEGDWYLDLGPDAGGVGAFRNISNTCTLYVDDWDDNGTSIPPALPLAALDLLLLQLQAIRAEMVSTQEGSEQ